MSNFMGVGIFWIGLNRADLGCWRLTLNLILILIRIFSGIIRIALIGTMMTNSICCSSGVKNGFVRVIAQLKLGKQHRSGIS